MDGDGVVDTERVVRHFEATDRRTRRRALAATALRTLLSLLVMTVVYFVTLESLPVDQFLVLLVTATVFSVVLLWQLRRVVRAKLPQLQAAESVVIIYALFLFLSATLHLLLDESRPGSYSEPLDQVSALYFVAAVSTTVGFGDITPVSDPARIITTIQMVAGLAFLGVIVRLIFKVARRELHRPAHGAPVPPQTAGADNAPVTEAER